MFVSIFRFCLDFHVPTCRLYFPCPKRCPELRPAIEGFWQRGGGAGGLELRLGVPGVVMSSLCRFIHSGVVDPPTSLQGCLQLLRAAKQLGMTSLEQLTAQLLGSRLETAPQQLSVVIAWADSTSSIPLQEVCKQVLAHLESLHRSSSSVISVEEVRTTDLAPQGELHFLASESLQQFMQEDDWEEQEVVEEAHCRSGGPLKPRSGGIYSLLLKASSSSSQATLSSDGPHTLQIKTAPAHKNRTPPTTTKDMTPSDRQSHKAPERRQPLPTARPGPSKEAKPQQQQPVQQHGENRAALLLAAAGPASVRPRGTTASIEAADERMLERKSSEKEQPNPTAKLNHNKNPPPELKSVGRYNS